MGSSITKIAIQAGKEAAKFLAEEYGDDALRALQGWIDKRRGANGARASTVGGLLALQALESGIKAALAELDRPYDEFFGPRVGRYKPGPDGGDKQ